MAGTSRPASSSAAAAASAAPSSPSTIGTMGDGWPGRTASMWVRKDRRSISPSGDRQISTASAAAAAAAGASPVVKMKDRARLTSRSIHGRGPAT